MSTRLAASGLLAIGALAATSALRASPAEDYVLYCMGCHGPEARGVPGKVPPLAESLGLFMRSPEGRNYLLRVPGAANSVLSDAQLAGVLNWLAARFPAPGAAPPADFTTEEVTQARRTPLPDVQARRHEVIGSLAATGAAPPLQY